MSANENKGAIGCAVYDVVPAIMCSAPLSVEKKDGIRRTMSANKSLGREGVCWTARKRLLESWLIDIQCSMAIWADEILYGFGLLGWPLSTKSFWADHLSRVLSEI
jgi:hypothetical protein